MSFQSSPSKSGIYRLKIYQKDQYVESIPYTESTSYSAWMRLAPPSGHPKQEWILTQSSSAPDEWKMACSFDHAGVLIMKSSQNAYRGYGFPDPGGESLTWKITDCGGYSRISAPSNGPEVFDAEYLSEGHDAVHMWHPLSQDQGPYQCYVFEFVGDVPGHVVSKVDVVFLQDATGSQQPYINAVRNEVMAISNQIKKDGGFVGGDSDNLRFSLIPFRDHPPEDTSYVVQKNPFTSDINTLQALLGQTVASGGGDAPEAQCDALDAALNAGWRDDAVKIVILITDSPPHGVEDTNIRDGFPDGCPQQKDPLRIVKLFAKNDITLHVIACEPTLSTYFTHAHDFYVNLVELTPNGTFIPFGVQTDTKHLKAAVTGVVLKTIDTTRLAAQHKSSILDRANAGHAHAQIAADLHRDLLAGGVQHHDVRSTDEVYLPNEQGAKNVQVWKNATQLKDVKGKLTVPTGDRISPDVARSGAYNVTLKKERITQQHVNAIIMKALRVPQL